jgi:hypothetical protein
MYIIRYYYLVNFLIIQDGRNNNYLLPIKYSANNNRETKYF